MASKRGQKRRECSGKKRHTKDEALREATRLRRLRVGESFDAYLCTNCNFWHVGHRTNTSRQQIAARRSEKRKRA